MKNLFLKNSEFPYRNIHWIIQGILNIVDGIIMICSLGFYYSTLEISYVELVAHQKFKNQNKPKIRRYHLIKDFRFVRENDYLISKNNKHYHWRPEFGYVNKENR